MPRTSKFYQPVNRADDDSSCALVTLLAVVTFQIALTAVNVVCNWIELTPLHYLIGIPVWVVLPLLAVALIWRRHMFGRWVLVGLFGLHGTGDVYAIANLASVYSPAILSAPGLRHVVNALFYLAVTGWLLFSPSLRGGRKRG
jgi:hypothetical protein